MAGEPLGGLPEIWRVTHRAPTTAGGIGRPVRWELVEPLASVVKEGVERYLAGASVTDLTDWAATTATGGVTPNGRQITSSW